MRRDKYESIKISILISLTKYHDIYEVAVKK